MVNAISRPVTCPVLIGRTPELGALASALEGAIAGAGQTVLISGEAGIGKSRITKALEERIAAEPRMVLRYFASAHYQDSPLFPVIGQLEYAARFRPEDSSADRIVKLEVLLSRSSTELQNDVRLLADKEGLTAHAASVSVRLDQ